MKLTDFAGDIDISPDSAVKFIQSWFHPSDRICLVGRRVIRTGNLDVVSQSSTAGELIAEIRAGLLQDLVFDPDGSSYNLYVGVCPILDDVKLFKRGTKDNVEYSPGVWADIDVKEGGFESEGDILGWLGSLPIRPTIICGSGSGGVHAYWRLHWDERGDGELVERWWAYLDEMAGHRSIDKLVDLTRILRVPGSIYFPKADSLSPALKMVKLIEASGITYSKDTLFSISADAYERRVVKRQQLRYADASSRFNAEALAQSLMKENGLMGKWALKRCIAQVEDYVNDTYDWFDILTPHGWTHRQELRDGSNEWARPGQKDRSAVTDFEKSPVMSLLSTSEDTGLADLKDAGIHLSKYRVLKRLNYQDQDDPLVRDVVAKMVAEANGKNNEPYEAPCL